MKRKNYLKITQSREDSGFARVLTILALMLTLVTTGAWAASFDVKEITSDMVSSLENDMSAVQDTDVPGFEQIAADINEAKAWTGVPQTGKCRLIFAKNQTLYYYVEFEDGIFAVNGMFNKRTQLYTTVITKGIKLYYTVAAAAPTAYTVSLKEGTEDATNWTITPAEATTTGVDKDTKITATYSGTKRVKSVTAVTKAATPATPAETTVTWNSENISFLQIYEPSAPFTMMGIMLSTSSASNTADWRNIGIPTNDGLYFNVTTTGGYTFTAPSGKKFTKIEMTVTNANGWTQVLMQSTLGTGWPSGGDAVSVVEDTKKVTWTGTAASTVGLLTDASYFNASPVTSIVFTLADAE